MHENVLIGSSRPWPSHRQLSIVEKPMQNFHVHARTPKVKASRRMILLPMGRSKVNASHAQKPKGRQVRGNGRGGDEDGLAQEQKGVQGTGRGEGMRGGEDGLITEKKLTKRPTVSQPKQTIPSSSSSRATTNNTYCCSNNDTERGTHTCCF